MKKLIVVLGIILVLVIAAVVALPFVIPTQTVIAQVQREVRQQTGRELRVDGPVDISVLPTASVRMQDVALANPQGARSETLASIGTLDVSIKLMPMLSGTVEIDRFRLVEPVINLEIAEDGTPSWTFGPDAFRGPPEPETGPGAGAGDGAGAAPGEEAGDRMPSDIALGTVEIVDGRLTFYDARTGRELVADDVDAEIDLPSLDQAAELDVGLIFNGEELRLTATVAEPRALLVGGETAVDVALTSDPLSAGFDGTIDAGSPPAGRGTATLDIPSVAALDSWSPVALPAIPVETVSFEGGIDAAPNRVSLSDFSLSADESTASGDLAVDLAGARPAVTGEVAVSALDLDALLAGAEVADEAVPEATPAPDSETDTAEAESAETDPAAEAPRPADDTIDLSMLDTATVDLTVDLGGLTVEGTEIGPTTLSIVLQDRRLDVEIADAAIFDGSVAGSVLVDGAAETPSFDLSVAVDSVDLAAPAAAFAGRDDVAGTLTLDLQAQGQGATRAALAQSLTGAATGALTGGAASIDNPQTGEPVAIEAVDLTFGMDSFDGPMIAEGSAGIAGETVAFSLNAGNPRALVGGGESALALTLDAPRARLSFDGTATGGAVPSVSGSLDTAVPSIRELAAWLPVDLSVEGVPVDSVSANGTLAASPERVALSGAQVSADDVSASGDVAVELADGRPSVFARLSMSFLDLDALLPAEDPGAAGGGDTGGGGSGDAAPAAPTDAGGWSTETIDLSPLQAADIDAVVELREGARVRGLEIGPATITALLQNGALDLSAPSVPVFQGTVSADVSVDAGAPSYRAALAVDSVQIEPVLQQFADSDRLSGTTDATINVTARGPSPSAIVSTLNGNGAMLVTDGALKGINIAEMVRNVGSAFSASNTGEAQETDFAELGASFTLTEGLLATDTLRLLAPLFRIEGTGTSSIPQRTLDFRLEPKVVGTLEGQGGQFEETGVRVPILVGGTWSDPTFRPDMAGLIQGTLEDPDAARRQVEGLVEGLEGGDIQPDDLLEGLFGGGGQQAPTETAPSEDAPADTAAPAPADTTEPAPETEPAQQNLEDQLQQDPVGTLRNLFGN